MRARFSKVAKELERNEAKIVDELLAAQGDAVDLGGYYMPDDEKAEKVMRPSATFNAIIDAM
jgi:isocitrate dehydrogenase